MERTSLGVDDRLSRRLDLLETRGRRVLSTMARRRALRRAFAWAAPASAAGPLVLALSALFAAPSPVGIVIAVAFVPLAAAGVGYARAHRTSERPRTAALALLDHRLRLNDRLQTSDEFARLESRSAFHDAALGEAAPWVARAQDSAVGDDAGPLRLARSRLWLWPAAGLVCLAIAFIVPRSGLGATASAGAAATGAAPRSAAVSDARSVVAPSISGPSPSASPRAAAETPARPGQGTPGAGIVAAFQTLMARLTSSRSDAAPAQDAAAPVQTPSQSAASGGEGAGAGGQGAAGTRASRSDALQDSEGGTTKDGAPQTPSSASAQDESDAPASQAASGQFAGPRQGAPSPNRAQPQDPGSGPPQKGEGQEPGRGRPGDRGQSGRDQSGGTGGVDQNPSADAGAKKGRGVSSLMLATPMEDRLSGMVSPGRVRTTTRDGAPQPLPAVPVQAQDRGAAQGAAAWSAPLTATAQEQRVTRDYFSARNGGGR